MKSQMIYLNDIYKELPNKYDVFIGSSSFEKRCLSVVSKLNPKIFSKCFIVYNREYIDYSKKYIKKQCDILGSHSTLIEISIQDPIITADCIKEKIIDYIISNKMKSILIDITTFSHESLLILVRLLKLYCFKVKITCIYTNAKEYCSGEEQGKKWLSKGIGEIRSVLGYPGNFIPAQKTHLIVIVGYEYERALSMINAIEPNYLSLGYGKSENATVEKDKEANLHYSHLVEQMLPSHPNLVQFEISCNDPYRTFTNLEEIISKIQDENIMIVPMNNKLSTIGVGLFALKNENIQICYSPALTYNVLNYSIPGSLCYIFDIE